MYTKEFIDLWVRIVESAVLDVLDPRSQGADFEECAEAYRWLMADDYSENGFRWACELCDITESTIERIRAKIC